MNDPKAILARKLALGLASLTSLIDDQKSLWFGG